MEKTLTHTQSRDPRWRSDLTQLSSELEQKSRLYLSPREIESICYDAENPGPRPDDIDVVRLYDLSITGQANYACMMRLEAQRQLYKIETALNMRALIARLEFRVAVRQAISELRKTPDTNERVISSIYSKELEKVGYSFYYIIYRSEVEILRIYPNAQL